MYIESDMMTDETAAILAELPPPHYISDVEKGIIDLAIENMCQRYRRERILVERPHLVNKDKAACQAIDRIIADALIEIRKGVPDESAEKLLQRFVTVEDWKNDFLQVGVLSIRFLDTMEALVSFKRKWRGRERKTTKYTKEEALGILRERGLTSRR